MSIDCSFLRKLTVFGALTDEAIRFLCSRAVEVEVEAGRSFFSQGESGDSMYVLLDGCVTVSRCDGEQDVLLAELGPGDCFGEMAMVAIQKRNATVRAVAGCRALQLRNMSILELYKDDLEQFALFQMNICREMARRLQKADQALFEERCRARAAEADGG